MRSNTFRDLNVWQRSRRLVSAIYLATKAFPKEEMYGLTNQLRRAAVSVPSNIAEGHRRGTPKEFKQFLIIARGSLAEIETQLTLSQDIEYLDEPTTTNLIKEVDEIGKMLNGLIKSIS